MNFIKWGSWQKKLRLGVKAEGRKIIGTKWVYKTKDKQDGLIWHKGQIVSLGYMQVPGVGYTQSFSPVGNDTSVRIVIWLTLFNDSWELEDIDVEVAFLEGGMEKIMHIKWPDGMVHLRFATKEEEVEYCNDQLKSMYGNANATLIYFRLFKKYLIKVLNLIQSLPDPCVCSTR
jgi:hypothetical protein